MSAFPTSPDELSTEWLGAVLGQPVAGFHTETIGEGIGVMARLARVELTYADASGAAATDAPATAIFKCPTPVDANREVATLYGFYRREVHFYRDLAGQLPIRTPRAYFSDMHESSVPFAILMEDLGGSRTVDQLEGMQPADVERVVDAIAALHARYWDAPELERLAWVPPVNNDQYKGFAAVMPQLVPVLEAKYGERLDPAGFGIVRDMCDLYTAYLDYWVATGPLTLIHYDLRSDNLMFDPPGEPGAVCLLDWQFPVRHRGTFDLSYLLGLCLLPTERRATEPGLLRRYHEALVGLGVTGYSFDRCWDDYRLGMLMHLISATQMAVLEGGNERGQRLIESMVERGWTAGLDLDVGAFLPKLREFARR